MAAITPEETEDALDSLFLSIEQTPGGASRNTSLASEADADQNSRGAVNQSNRSQGRDATPEEDLQDYKASWAADREAKKRSLRAQQYGGSGHAHTELTWDR